MGIRSRVGILQENKIRSVYIHLDGGILEVGDYLSQNIPEEKIEAFLQEGDRRSIFTEERYESQVTSDTEVEFIQRAVKEGCEYLYLLKKGVWLACIVRLQKKGFSFVPLSKLIEVEKKLL